MDLRSLSNHLVNWIADREWDEFTPHGIRAEVMTVSTKVIMLGLHIPGEWYWGYKEGEPKALRGLMEHRTRHEHKASLLDRKAKRIS